MLGGQRRTIGEGLARWQARRSTWTVCAAAVMFVLWFNLISPGWAILCTLFYVALDVVVWGSTPTVRVRLRPAILALGLIALLLVVARS